MDGEPGPAADRLRQALPLHHQHEDARGEAWTMYYLGQALEERGEHDAALRQLERSRAADAAVSAYAEADLRRNFNRS